MKKKILWLDDEPDNIAVELMLIEDILKSDECVDVVEDMPTCIKHLSTFEYQAVILDLQINLGPNADATQQTWVGAAVYAWLRGNGALPKTSPLPNTVCEQLLAYQLSPKPENTKAPVAIVSGIAKSKVVEFIRERLSADSAEIKLQVFDKPVDERRFTRFIQSLVNVQVTQQ